jgi:hypothetical protein
MKLWEQFVDWVNKKTEHIDLDHCGCRHNCQNVNSKICDHNKSIKDCYKERDDSK